MSNELETSSETPTAGHQRRQANILLLRLQWLVILLLIIALVWIYVSQQRFQNQVNERLQSNEQVVTRLNEMDDRLFAVNQQALPTPSNSVGSQAQNQLDLLRIQMQAVDRLLLDNNDKSAIELLRGLQWQLSQQNNEIAPSLTTVIKQSLIKDIERLQAQSAQPSPWQLQNIAIQNIQEFLHTNERNINEVGSRKLNNQNKQVSSTAISNNSILTRRQLTIHEVIMTLNLAIQASNMREVDQLGSYLQQARTQLQTLTNNQSTPKKSFNTISEAAIESRNDMSTIQAPSNIAEVIVWLDKLIANAPIPTSLSTTQVLEQQNATLSK